MYYIANCSFGKDSLAMVLLLIEKHMPLDEVIFYNSGMEFSCIYDIRDQVVPLLHENGIKYTEFTPDNTFYYDLLERPVRGRSTLGYGWCGGLCRWGTTNKVRTIESYLRCIDDDITQYIGIAADETNRIKDKIYPLVDFGMKEHDCLEYCYSKGYFWCEDSGFSKIRLYDILDRVSCWCCCNKNLRELKNIYVYLPNYWNKLRELQLLIARPFKGFYKGSPVGIFELEQRFRDEIEKGHL